jgi:ABC-type multidrug transport system ATPase subunit
MVYQQDSFFPMLSVRETLHMAASLRLLFPIHNDEQRDALNNNLTDNSINNIIETIMQSLSLSHVGNSPVGEATSGDNSGSDLLTTRGISGGERKRLAVGCELPGNPRLLMADEPTSGLDAFQALQVMQLLHNLASKPSNTLDDNNDNNVKRPSKLAVICTIHQPRSSIWELFDDILLLTPNGRAAYHGPRGNVLPYFKSLGFMCPEHTNPAEFLIDLGTITIQHAWTKIYLMSFFIVISFFAFYMLEMLSIV